MKSLLHFLLLLQGAFGLKPYDVLGVHRNAPLPEIKKAYKALVKIWHPDKSSDPEAESRFVEINRSYELLSDPERRRQYDNFGITEDTPNFRKTHDYSQYQRFDSFFSEGFRFSYGGDSSEKHSAFHKVSVNSKTYYATILPASFRVPYLLLFYSDWCFTCSRVEPIWRRLVSELEPVGFGIASVHTEHEKELTRKIGVKDLPHFILLLNGKPYHYKEPSFSSLKILEFIRRKFPYKLLEILSDSKLDSFLGGWKDNKVRVVIFGKTDSVRLRYLTTAFKFSSRATFGYVKIGDEDSRNVIKRFEVPLSEESLFVFHESSESPVARLSNKELSLTSLNEILEANIFLGLPRLSSQSVFDDLCPPESSYFRKRLCVLLIVGEDEEKVRKSLLSFALSHKFSHVRFVYLISERQSEFVSSLKLEKGKETEENNRIIILWRKESFILSYEITSSWIPGSFNESCNQLKQKIILLLKSSSSESYFSKIVSFKELQDENAISFLTSLCNKLLEFGELFRESISKDEILPAVSIVLSVALILIGGYVMNYLVQLEEESVRKNLGSKGMKVDKKGLVIPELKIHEMRAETYNGMVRLLKPGCRTLVLIVDRESKEKLVHSFYKMAWPYRRNKTLMFGFLFIEKGLPWFKKILNLTLPEPRDIVINPKNCIGTVLSLNGHRRYFCMYHAKHPEGSRKRVYVANNGHGGAFMGFDSDLENSSEDERETDVEGAQPPKNPSHLDSPDNLPIFEEQLLDGLQPWLDRLFEGSTHRYHINYWPEFPISPSSFTSSSV